MVVANRPGREKPTKIEQRKFRGQEREPQVKQIALLAGPETEKHKKKGQS